MVETGLKASPTGRGEQDESQLGPLCSLEAASGQGHQRQGTALGYMISKITLGSGSQNFGREDAPLALTALRFKGTDGLWISSLPRQIQTLELLVNGILPGFSLARITLQKTKQNQQPRGLLDTHWSRVDEDIQHVPTPNKGWDQPGNHFYYTAAARTEQAWRGTGSCAWLQLQAFPHFGTVTPVLFMPPHSC